MPWKKILLGCSIASAIIIVFFLRRVYSGPRPVPQQDKVPPPDFGDWKQPAFLAGAAVIKGEGLFTRQLLFEEKLGDVTDIVSGDLDSSPGPEIGVASQGGALFLDTSGTVKSRVNFAGMTYHVDLVDIEGDGVCEFMNRGFDPISASVLDHSGKVLWTYGGRPGCDIAAGDVDGDGKLEFAVGFTGKAGSLHLLEADGKQVWKQQSDNPPWPVIHVEMPDIDDDGISEIAYSTVAAIILRKGDGEIIRQIKTSNIISTNMISTFSLCEWPAGEKKGLLMLDMNNTIWCLDYSGQTIAKLPAPDCGNLGDARGAWFKPGGGAPEYFAVLVNHDTYHSATLYIYNNNQELVYQETLRETGAAIAVLPLEQQDKEALLVGGSGKVWKYVAASPGIDRNPGT